MSQKKEVDEDQHTVNAEMLATMPSPSSRKPSSTGCIATP